LLAPEALEVYINAQGESRTVPNTPPPPRPGDLIAGKYRLESELGRGGMGAVYAVRHGSTGRRFAIKLLNRELSGNADAEARFLREAMLASSINHPAIVEVYDVGRADDTPYMVMKLLEGETLAQRLERGPLRPEEVVELLLPVLHGVAAAHGHGIIHRDLKPENIMLARDSGTVQPKILDFGISKLLSADARTRLTLTGVSIGTPLYMSPEQVRGDDDVDGRTDVYALAVILYQSLTGSMPFDGNNYADLVVKIVMGNAPGIRAWNPDLPAELEAIVSRAMAAARDERHRSVSELAADLARFRGVRPSNVAARMSLPRPSAATPGGATPRASAATPRMSAPRAPSGPTPFTSETLARETQPRARGPLYASLAIGFAALAAMLVWLFWPAAPQSTPTSAAAGQPPHAPTPASAAPSVPAGIDQHAPVPAAAHASPATTAAAPPQAAQQASAAPPVENAQQRPATAPRAAHAQSTSEVSARPARRARNRTEHAEPAEGAAGAEPPEPTIQQPVSDIIDPFQ